MYRPSMDDPGKSLLDVIVQKGIKSHFPGSVEDWEQWGERERAQAWRPEVSEICCLLALSAPTPLTLELPV